MQEKAHVSDMSLSITYLSRELKSVIIADDEIGRRLAYREEENALLALRPRLYSVPCRKLKGLSCKRILRCCTSAEVDDVPGCQGM